MCVLLPTALAFSVAGFADLSDIHKHSGGLQLAVPSISEQQASCKSPHNCLVMLSIGSIIFCSI